MIELRNVYIKYIPDFYTLYDISLIIKENTLFIGDIYSGANSLIRILSKIDTDYKGIVTIDDIILRDIKDKNLDLAYVSAEPYLFKSKSIFDNLYYPLKIRKVNSIEAKEKVEKLLIEFNIQKFPKKIKDMNISEQKILTLLRALARSPKYILLENFFENLDEKYLDLSQNIIDRMKESSIIIACENTDLKIPCYQDFTRVYLDAGSIVQSRP